jgi:hypothetical protein
LISLSFSVGTYAASYSGPNNNGKIQIMNDVVTPGGLLDAYFAQAWTNFSHPSDGMIGPAIGTKVLTGGGLGLFDLSATLVSSALTLLTILTLSSFSSDSEFGSPCKSMQVDYYQRVTGIGATNKNL